MTSWGQWIAAFASTYTVVANLLPFFLVMVLLITGVLIPYCIILPISLTKAQLTVVWRYTMYYIISSNLSHQRCPWCSPERCSCGLLSSRNGNVQSTQWTNLWSICERLCGVVAWISGQS